MVSRCQPIAAFDVDDTLVSGQTQAMLVRDLARRHLLPLSTIIAVAAWFCGYYLGLPMPHSGIRLQVLRSLSGLSIREVDDLAKDLFHAHIKPRIRMAAVRRIAALKHVGVVSVLISASAAPIVRPISTFVGATHLIATELDVAGGILTGRISGPVAEGGQKLTALTQWADRTFERWELAEAYSDHVSDAPLMSAARIGYAVNPSGRLKKMAVANGWICVDWKEEECLD